MTAQEQGRGGTPRPGADIVGSLRQWVITQALPLWANAGFDHQRGGFHEYLRPDATADPSATRRLRVQARQIYVYAHAAALGWYPSGRAVALAGVDHMVSMYANRDGRPGYIHLLAPDGSIANSLRDTYDHMFVLLGLAWTARASGDAQVQALIDDVLAFVDEHLTAPDGSFIEGIPRCLPRRQNPHMHAFEAMLALHEAIAHPQAIGRAQRLLDMFQSAFFDHESKTLGEYFTDDWEPVPGPEGDSIEPGHHAEWAWLLRRHERLTGASRGVLTSELLQTALRFADPATGFLIDDADRNGTVRRATRRTWPQTELAKAWLAEAETGRQGAAEAARVALAAVTDHYLDRPFVGGWTDQFDAAGSAITYNVPASTFYHVFCMIAEADRVIGTPQPGGATADSAEARRTPGTLRTGR
jgi:mannose/cellobiose epimerase-like protein (N-acyl-D-glucosamine 2-epimerase family)